MYNIFSYLRTLTTTDIKSSYTKDELHTLINFMMVLSKNYLEDLPFLLNLTLPRNMYLIQCISCLQQLLWESHKICDRLCKNHYVKFDLFLEFKT